MNSPNQQSTNVFITGASGFLGKNFVKQLQQQFDHKIFALSRNSTSDTRLQDAGVTPVRGDITDINSLQKAFKDFNPQMIIHLAAEIATQKSKKKIWKVNYQGTRNLYLAAKELPDLKLFLFSSTVVAGDAKGKVLIETDPIFAETEYGKSKFKAEDMLLEAFNTHQFPVVILRPSHIYGPGGWFGGIVQDIKRNFFYIPGDGKNLWDIIHIDDAVKACICLMMNGKPGEIYHAVDDTPVTMNDFFDQVAKLIGKKKIGHVPIFLASLIKGKEPVMAATRSARSTNKKLKLIGWRPTFTSYQSGLEKTFQSID